MYAHKRNKCATQWIYYRVVFLEPTTVRRWLIRSYLYRRETPDCSVSTDSVFCIACLCVCYFSQHPNTWCVLGIRSIRRRAITIEFGALVHNSFIKFGLWPWVLVSWCFANIHGHTNKTAFGNWYRHFSISLNPTESIVDFRWHCSLSNVWTSSERCSFCHECGSVPDRGT